MRYYCTLFDKNYLFKGLALHSSLMEHARDFRLFVLCMDSIAFDVLSRLELPCVELIRLADFEDADLLKAKQTRSVAEYCWTCTPSLPLYVMENHPAVDLITYLDADIYFFGNPEPIFSEMGTSSVLITPHRFITRLQYLAINGIYNVQFVSFRRDENGLKCLRWWRDRCNEWCFNRLEDGKLGDQKYLDNWPTQFAGVHELAHLGGGVAPWNFSQYSIEQKGNHILVDDHPLIFYHFHQFRIYRGGKYFYMSGMYTMETPAPEAIYRRYIRGIEDAMRRVEKVVPRFREGTESYIPVMLQAGARRFLPTTMKNLIKRRLGFVFSKPS